MVAFVILAISFLVAFLILIFEKIFQKRKNVRQQKLKIPKSSSGTSTFRGNTMTSQNERRRRMSKNKMKLLLALYPNYDLSLLSKFPFDAHHPFSVPRKFLESKPGSARLKMARNRLSSKLAHLRMIPIEDQRYMQNIMNDGGYLPQTTYISGSSEI